MKAKKTTSSPPKNTTAPRQQAQAPIRLRKILVPVDFSPAAQKALHYAVSFAGQFGAGIILLHVVQPPIYPTELGYVPVEIESLNKTIREAAETQIEKWARESVPEGISSKTAVRLGHPYQEITLAAKELAADMIVISTHGYTGLKHVLLGSTAERIVRHAGCPVLVVRERERDFV